MMNFTHTYTWIKDNDLPNTFTFVVTSIIWPVVVIWWHRHKVHSIPNLLVAFMPGSTTVTINNVPYPAVYILFENQTGFILYITGPRIRNCSKLFPVPTTAVRDFGQNVHPLSFAKPIPQGGMIFAGHQVTLQTNGKADSIMGVTTAMPQSFYEYRTPWLRRVFRWRKYFILEYTAMVGEKKYRVATVL
jgi:hypothetical protein